MTVSDLTACWFNHEVLRYHFFFCYYSVIEATIQLELCYEKYRLNNSLSEQKFCTLLFLRFNTVLLSVGFLNRMLGHTFLLEVIKTS